MAQILAHPFRVDPSGTIATVDDTSDAGEAQLLTALLLTETGSRPLTPDFGISSPVFTVLEPTQIAAGIAEFGPDINLVEVTAVPASSGTVNVTITYD